MKAFHSLLLNLALASMTLMVRADTAAPIDPAVNPKAARSVHLHYPAPEGGLFYNELTVEKTVPGSYFMACGFSRGYFGIQELPDGKKVVIFSVWDPTAGNDPNAVKPEDRVEILSQGEGVDAKRFGGEGTGGQSFWNYDWKVGTTYKFLVTSKIEPEHITFTGYFFVPQQKRWQQMASFRTKMSGAPLTSLYSFIEDFRRDGKSANQIRRAHFGNGWLQSLSGDWVSLQRAVFTADGNAQLHINAGVSGNAFFLQNGGSTIEKMALGASMTRPIVGVDLPEQAGK